MGVVQSYVAYPFKAIYKKTWAPNPSPAANVTYSNMQEFNSSFSRKEEEIKDLKRKLFNNANSAVKTFNANMLFRYTDLLYENLRITNRNEPTGESSIQRKKLILIVEKIIELYTTEYSRGFTAYHSEEGSIDNCYKKRISYLNNNLNRIGRTYNEIQPFLNTNNDIEYDEFETRINNEFNEEFLSKNSIKQYFNQLIYAIQDFDLEVSEHYSFFRDAGQSWEPVERNIWHYTAGWFTWFSRSGYTYKGTANFYRYFRNNNIANLRTEITNQLTTFTNAAAKIKEIKEMSLYLDYHIRKDYTDKFVIEFNYDNDLKQLIEIKLGHFFIETYELLCEDIQSKVKEKLISQNLNNITFSMSHKNEGNEKAVDTVLIQSNTKFKLKDNSTVMKWLGWRSYQNYTSREIVQKLPNGFQSVECGKTDNDCFFHSVMYWLTGEIESGYLLKKLLTKFVVNNEELQTNSDHKTRLGTELRKFISTSPKFENSYDIEKSFERMKEGNTDFTIDYDILLIIQAIRLGLLGSRCENISFRIWGEPEGERKEGQWLLIDEDSVEAIYINQQPGHFQALVPEIGFKPIYPKLIANIVPKKTSENEKNEENPEKTSQDNLKNEENRGTDGKENHVDKFKPEKPKYKYFLKATLHTFDEELDEQIKNTVISRHNNMVATLTNLNHDMDIQNTPYTNNN